MNIKQLKNNIRFKYIIQFTYNNMYYCNNHLVIDINKAEKFSTLEKAKQYIRINYMKYFKILKIEV